MSHKFIGLLQVFVDKIGNARNFNEITNQYERTTGNIYVLKIENYRVFFTVNDSDKETILLLDFVKK